MPRYRCNRCGHETDNRDAFIQHKIKEALSEKPEVEPQKRTHRTVKDHLDCPQCYPKFAKEMKEHPKFVEDLKSMGYRKRDICPKHGTELVKPLLDKPFCPKCHREKGSLIY